MSYIMQGELTIQKGGHTLCVENIASDEAFLLDTHNRQQAWDVVIRLRETADEIASALADTQVAYLEKLVATGGRS